VSTYFRHLKALRLALRRPLLTLLFVGAVSLIWGRYTVTAQTTAGNKDDASLIEAFRHVEVASVSDALANPRNW
jgi:hypothetical protein